MPFTLAHPAAILPLRRLGLPLTALVAGSLAPDVPLYVPGGILGGRDEAHSWTHTWFGIAVFDLPVGVLLTLAWVLLLADPVRDGAPDWARERLPEVMRRDRRWWSLVAPAALIGTLTHLAWDQVTHEPSWVTERVPLLVTDVAGLPVARWLMYLCSVLGLLVLAWAAHRGLQRRPLRPATRQQPVLAQVVWPLPLTAATLAAAYEMITVGPYMGTHAMIYYMLTAAVAAGAAVLTVVALCWQLARA